MSWTHCLPRRAWPSLCAERVSYASHAKLDELVDDWESRKQTRHTSHKNRWSKVEQTLLCQVQDRGTIDGQVVEIIIKNGTEQTWNAVPNHLLARS